MFYTRFLGELANALGHAGELAKALEAIGKAIDICDRRDERWFFAELVRIKGELIRREGASQAEKAAEEQFLRSLDWARRQGALSWELRTSTSLARLQQEQGRTAGARSLLKSVYGRFSEGFDTSDLKTAKAYLDDLP
jgi:predicted ATPase